MNKLIVKLILLQVLFTACGKGQPETMQKGKWISAKTEYYNKKSTINVRSYSDYRKDSIYFSAYHPKDISKRLEYRDFTSVMNAYMSSTEQRHYDTLYYENKAPKIDPNYKKGRYSKDELHLVFRFEFSYEKNKYEIMKTLDTKQYQKDSIPRFFVFIRTDLGNQLLDSYPAYFDKIIPFLDHLRPEIAYYLFDIKSDYTEGAVSPPIIQEIKTYATYEKGKILDINRLLYLIETWKQNNNQKKISTIYETN